MSRVQPDSSAPCTRRSLLAGAAALATSSWAHVSHPARGADAAAASRSRHPFGRPLVFAHRGASGERPEHTLAAYRLAMEQGADYVEPDLWRTKDGAFVCIHDSTLERTTDVAARPEFAARARPDAKGVPRWPVGDFTLAELKTLTTRQGTRGRPAAFDGTEPIPTFAEMIEVVRRHNAEHDARVGIAPELKNGDADAFVDFVRDQGLESGGAAGPTVPLHVQSFDLATVLAVRQRVASPCVWLTGKRPADPQIDELAGRIDGFSMAKDALLAADPAAFVARLHAAGHCVVAWTFADDRHDAGRFGSAAEELAAALAAGIDAFFTDFPASGAAARNRLLTAE